jgi:hypothetical protein
MNLRAMAARLLLAAMALSLPGGVGQPSCAGGMVAARAACPACRAHASVRVTNASHAGAALARNCCRFATDAPPASAVLAPARAGLPAHGAAAAAVAPVAIALAAAADGAAGTASARAAARSPSGNSRPTILRL